MAVNEKVARVIADKQKLGLLTSGVWTRRSLPTSGRAGANKARSSDVMPRLMTARGDLNKGSSGSSKKRSNSGSSKRAAAITTPINLQGPLFVFFGRPSSSSSSLITRQYTRANQCPKCYPQPRGDFYLLTRGFNWEVELNMEVAQSPYERKGYS